MDTHRRFDGRVALVTGGYRGMGGESAKALAREGATVIAADIIPGAPPEAGPGVHYRQLDVTSPEAWAALGIPRPAPKAVTPQVRPSLAQVAQ